MSTPPEPYANLLARRWQLEINMGTTAVPDWQVFPGISEFQPASEPNFEDSSAYEDGGWAGNEKTGQEWELSVTFTRRGRPTAKTYHPVHEKVHLAHYAYGAANKVHLRYMDRDEMPEAYEGFAVPNWAPAGGSRTDLEQIELTLTGDGPLLPIANPLATP
ncbi:phage tail tube protein [Streptomyces sp. NPDC056500]|uniref:phage tail tube protein n=1 Tax=Streptomyces sp. NPDC056500 TaxID=3345840 RepID=UPI0036ACF084